TSRRSRLARSIIPRALRSFTLLPGFSDSSLPYTSIRRATSETLLSLISGVSPISVSTLATGARAPASTGIASSPGKFGGRRQYRAARRRRHLSIRACTLNASRGLRMIAARRAERMTERIYRDEIVDAHCHVDSTHFVPRAFVEGLCRNVAA